MIDLGIRGHLHGLDRTADGALKAVQQAPLTVGEEQDGVPFPPGAPGPADAVHVGLTVKGGVVIDHQADAIHIESASGDVGGDQHIHLSLLEPLDRPLPQGLGHITVEHRAGHAFGIEGFRHRHGDGFGAGKNDHPTGAMGFKNPQEGPQLLMVG